MTLATFCPRCGHAVPRLNPICIGCTAPPARDVPPSGVFSKKAFDTHAGKPLAEEPKD